MLKERKLHVQHSFQKRKKKRGEDREREEDPFLCSNFFVVHSSSVCSSLLTSIVLLPPSTAHPLHSPLNRHLMTNRSEINPEIHPACNLFSLSLCILVILVARISIVYNEISPETDWQTYKCLARRVWNYRKKILRLSPAFRSWPIHWIRVLRLPTLEWNNRQTIEDNMFSGIEHVLNPRKMSWMNWKEMRERNRRKCNHSFCSTAFTGNSFLTTTKGQDRNPKNVSSNQEKRDRRESKSQGRKTKMECFRKLLLEEKKTTCVIEKDRESWRQTQGGRSNRRRWDGP